MSIKTMNSEHKRKPIRSSLFKGAVCLWILSFACSLVFAQEPAAPKLFIRYEKGATLYRLSEDLEARLLSIPLQDRGRIAIRVCSKEPLIVALPLASASPFQLAKALKNKFDYSDDKVIFLRSVACSSSAQSAITEVWTIPRNGALPVHDELELASHVKMEPLGNLTVYPGMKDYRRVVQKLIKQLKAKPGSVGVVMGYYFRHPSRALERNLNAVRQTLGKSGVSSDRYVVREKLWDDEFSVDDREPVNPSVFLIFVDRSSP